jgi:hypothetical protein
VQTVTQPISSAIICRSQVHELAPTNENGEEFWVLTAVQLFKAYTGERAWKAIGDRLQVPS